MVLLNLAGFHSEVRTVVRSGTDVRRLGLALQLIPEVPEEDGFRTLWKNCLLEQYISWEDWCSHKSGSTVLSDVPTLTTLDSPLWSVKEFAFRLLYHWFRASSLLGLSFFIMISQGVLLSYSHSLIIREQGIHLGFC